MKKTISEILTKSLFIITTLLLLTGCADYIRPSSVYISILTNPPEAKVYYYVSSKTIDVKESKKVFLGKTPYRRALMLDIDGLDGSNAHNVIFNLEIQRKGYYKKIERIDFQQILGIREVRLKYKLNKREAGADEDIDPSAAPPTPEMVTASDGIYKDYVKITWSKVKNAEKYYIYRDTNTNGSFKDKLALVKGLQFLDKTAEPGKKYYYKVQAFNNIGKSQLSKAAQGSVKDSDEKDDKEKSDKAAKEAGKLPSLPSLPATGGGVGFPAIAPIPIGGGKGGKTKKKAKGIFKNISG